MFITLDKHYNKFLNRRICSYIKGYCTGVIGSLLGDIEVELTCQTCPIKNKFKSECVCLESHSKWRNSKLRILVIFTGGTIGSSVSNGYISTDVQKRYKLLEMYQSNADKEIDFKLLEPYTMISENLTGESIARLCTVVKDNLSEEYDGVIITHGTDTLQYSACALGYYLQTVKIPVLLVSSNYVLDDGRANGLVNFIASVSFIEQKAGTGVFVPYRNDDGIVYIHRGTRLLPHRPYSDNIYSIDDQYYAVYDADADEIRKNQKYHASDNKVINVTSLPAKWNSDIMRIFPYPGFQYSNLKMDQNYKYMPKAALLDTYHSGTLCSEEDDLELFLTQADK